MAKSRLALLLLPLLLAGPAAAAGPDTAEAFLEAQREKLRSGIGLSPCPPPGGQAEIVVCGRRGPDPYRLPLASDPDPGARRAGVPADGRALLALGAEPCTSARRQRRSDGLDMVAVAATLASLAATALDVRTPEAQPVKKCS
jgi:hypothetical protein